MLNKLSDEKPETECEGEFVINKLTGKTCGDGFNERVYKITKKGNNCLHTNKYKEKVPLSLCEFEDKCYSDLDCESKKCTNNICTYEDIGCNASNILNCNRDLCLQLNDGLEKEIYMYINDKCIKNPCNEDTYELCEESECNDLGYKYKYNNRTNICRKIIQDESVLDLNSYEYQLKQSKDTQAGLCETLLDGTNDCVIGGSLNKPVARYYCKDGFYNSGENPDWEITIDSVPISQKPEVWIKMLDKGPDPVLEIEILDKMKKNFINNKGTNKICGKCPLGSAGSGGICLKCPAGTVPNSDNSRCEPCEKNQISISGECIGCPPGQEAAPGQSRCRSCEGDTHSVGGESCSSCPATTSANSAKTGCESITCSQWPTKRPQKPHVCGEGRVIDSELANNSVSSDNSYNSDCCTARGITGPGAGGRDGEGEDGYGAYNPPPAVHAVCGLEQPDACMSEHDCTDADLVWQWGPYEQVGYCTQDPGGVSLPAETSSGASSSSTTTTTDALADAYGGTR